MAVFEKIDLVYRAKLKKLLYETIVKEARTEQQKKGLYEFMVMIEGVKFRTYMSDSELQEAIILVIDLLEELKEINNRGLDSTSFKGIQSEISEEMKEKDEYKIYLGLKDVPSIYTEKGCQIKDKMATICRVDDTGVAFINNLLMDKIIYVIYQQIENHFDKEELYVESAFVILRNIIKMRSEDLPE